MPPKRGQKRKSNTAVNGNSSNGNTAVLAPPDRETWQGWVEMESEPAFFNVMLKEMGVRGVKVQEVLSIDEDMLAMLPQPVHALIFLFRYRTQDEQDQYTGTQQDHIWFANQVPDFACATIATLNIVNNIPGLQMGKELRDFRDFTNDMDPVTRGEMIDDFAFVRRIHNSFARENDLLTADLHAQEKIGKAKKKAATAKAQATKAAKKAEREAKEEALNGPSRASQRSSVRRGSKTPSTTASTPVSKAVHSADASPQPEQDGDFKLSGKGKPRARLNLKGPRKPEASEEDGAQPRRSGRARKVPNRDVYVSEAEESPQEGFHFVAYMPIDDHVWKMDGLDYHPHDMGTFGLGGNGADGGTGNWMHVVAPALQNRMSAAELEGEISFTLLAVVHDPIVDDRKSLFENIKALQAIDKRLDALYDDWRSLDGAETSKETLLGPSDPYDIFNIDLDETELPASVQAKTSSEEDFMTLIEYRKPFLTKQAQIRSSIRSAKMMDDDDEEKARHRRHDYGTFVRKWMTALAEQEILGDLLK
ncbi:Putative peptidase C12, ubiquitin carboxyl-terminal hydrolase [Septoria linicola]|uniref:Ubiquitin carboxyl-terminal hydrolase n=1 Tax=Septoria linicola TaxID=215465 RepID=A0A9Q9B6L7_9PEZI|nr:putative peptidase C12, ubiquitin carboxyl-terminal hydrolase [Septoria linicola]USW59200.1 Putative peptidase C12, ubiquitin carboxyl-terminal hydrolase [Septoria linicola]